MVDITSSERRRAAPIAILLIGLIPALMVVSAAVLAVQSGLGLTPLPYPLFVVLQKLPFIFPLHMIAAGCALLLIPAAFLARRHRNLHRALGRLAAACVLVGGVTALLVAAASEAGLAARAGFFVQGLVWIALLVAAITAIRSGNRALHARLMIAMACVASGALWLRLVMTAAVALGWPFDTVYAVAAWACWLVPLAIAGFFARTISAPHPEEPRVARRLEGCRPLSLRHGSASASPFETHR